MPSKSRVDLQAFKCDYEAGMPGKNLEAKYHIGANVTSYYAHKAGATIRRGRGPASGNGRKPAPVATRSAIASAGGNLKARRKAGSVAPSKLSLLPSRHAADIAVFTDAVAALEKQQAEIDQVIEFLNRQMGR